TGACRFSWLNITMTSIVGYSHGCSSVPRIHAPGSPQQNDRILRHDRDGIDARTVVRDRVLSAFELRVRVLERNRHALGRGVDQHDPMLEVAAVHPVRWRSRAGFPPFGQRGQRRVRFKWLTEVATAQSGAVHLVVVLE